MARRKRSLCTAPSYALPAAWAQGQPVNGALAAHEASSKTLQPQQSQPWLPTRPAAPPARSEGSSLLQAQAPQQQQQPQQVPLPQCRTTAVAHPLQGVASNTPAQQAAWLVRRQPAHVEWLAVCPQHLEQHARMFLSEVSACYLAQGCGTHLPAAWFTHVRTLGGVAVVPRDAVPQQQHQQSSWQSQQQGHQAAAHAWSSQPPASKGASSTAQAQQQLTAAGVRSGAQPLMHPVVGMVNNCAGGAPVAVGLQGSGGNAGAAQGALSSEPCAAHLGELHAWRTNYISTLAGICWSLAARSQQLPSSIPWPAAASTWNHLRPPACLIIYLISPSDDCRTALSCLEQAACQLSAHSASPRTCGAAVASPAPPSTAGQDQGALDRTEHDVMVTTPPEQQGAEGTSPDSVAPARPVVLQVLLPSLLQHASSHTACHTALASHALVLNQTPGTC